MYSEAELTVLADFARVRKARPSEILSDAMTLVAMLGGYLKRKNDGPPDSVGRPDPPRAEGADGRGNEGSGRGKQRLEAT